MKLKALKKVIAASLSAVTLVSLGNVSVYSPAVNAADNENYLEALALSLYFFDANQCGGKVDDNPLTWRGNCHTYDGEASIGSAYGLDSAAVSAIKAVNGGKDTVDVSGGYHDAGDHIKFNLTMGFAASSLAMSWYMNPGVYAKAGCEGHLYDILRETCDYFMKTTFLNDDGSVAAVCHTVSDGADHSIWTAPEVQTYDRKTYWLTSAENNSAICGEMASALGGAAYILKAADPDYSAKCLKYAKALYDFGNKHVGNEMTGMGSFYPTDSMYQDEMAIAQTWLYLNGEGSLPEAKPSSNENGCYEVNGQKIYDYDKYTWDKVWSGYATFMYYITGDEAFAKEMQFELNNKGGVPENKYNAAGWGASRYNCALQMVALGLAKGDGDSSFAKGAKFQTDYILGNNQLGYSFLIGYGSKWPTHIHHRAANPGEGNQTSAENPNSKYVLYGALIGGPDSDGNYQDHADQYQFTEPALDYNACFALACAGLANLYGGDADAINDLIKNASEIDENHKFSEPVTLPDQPTEPTSPTTETTEPTTESTEPTEGTTNPIGVETDPTEPTFNYNDYLLGDVNKDGYVNVFDVVAMRREFLYHGNSWIAPECAGPLDSDGDGKFKVNDIVLLSQYIAGKDVELKYHEWDMPPAP